MKTLEEFIQRLQDDPGFERQAHAFDNGDDLIAFAKREGYDFTLEELMLEFAGAGKSSSDADAMMPLPAEVSSSPAPRPPLAELPSQPEALSGAESGAVLLEAGDGDPTREQPMEMPPQLKAAKPPRPEEPKFPRPPESWSPQESGIDLSQGRNHDIPREPPLERVPQPKPAMPPPVADAEPQAGLFKGGGGRHRGFSAQRLKPTIEEET